MFRVTVQSGFYWVPKMTRSFYKYFSSGYIFLSNKEKECITQRDEFSKSLYIHLYLLRYRLYFLWFFCMFRYSMIIKDWYEKEHWRVLIVVLQRSSLCYEYIVAVSYNNQINHQPWCKMSLLASSYNMCFSIDGDTHL